MRRLWQESSPLITQHPEAGVLWLVELPAAGANTAPKAAKAEFAVEAGVIGPAGPLHGLHEASVISEGDFRAERPLIVGLISKVIGSDDPERVEATYRRLGCRACGSSQLDPIELRATPTLLVSSKG